MMPIEPYNERGVTVTSHDRGSPEHADAGMAVVSLKYPDGKVEFVTPKLASVIGRAGDGLLGHAAKAAVHQPLPVAGYTPQPEENVALVNEGKEIQERVLRYLDKIASVAVQREEHGREFGKGKIGMRELALGRTNIETGFMWAFRAVFNPTRIALPEDAVPAESDDRGPGGLFPPRPE